jgi:hypothetical protein
MSAIDKLCDRMRSLQYNYSKELSKVRGIDVDREIALRAKVNLLEILLQEAAGFKITETKSDNDE